MEEYWMDAHLDILEDRATGVRLKTTNIMVNLLPKEVAVVTHRIEVWDRRYQGGDEDGDWIVADIQYVTAVYEAQVLKRLVVHHLGSDLVGGSPTEIIVDERIVAHDQELPWLNQERP